MAGNTIGHPAAVRSSAVLPLPFLGQGGSQTCVCRAVGWQVDESRAEEARHEQLEVLFDCEKKQNLQNKRS